ncbi:hypothetical protein JAAARDRAFT_41933 [Jaapia argillacea MUCL 33604]|uniref:Ebp2-domain-containing protein n=1 Tax=Jaapia argillacea MUCL 33604 TaxID=933084 RepID=A0A067PHJ8_9AGAM|nr:hypothetical protein JAAARDRAFT_41933 [Jaapia argillacea MUCL 33604]
MPSSSKAPKPTQKAPKTTPKDTSKPLKSKGKARQDAIKIVEENDASEDDDWEDEDESEEDEDEEDGGVDEEGMARLLKALGEDGLDEFELAQLKALGGEDEGSEEDKDEESASEVEGEEEKLDDESDSEDDVEDGEDQDIQMAGEEEDVVALDELEEGSLDEDAVPRQKIEVENKIALERIRDTIKLDPSLPWTETLSVTYPEMIEVDVNDDLKRELTFYKQALHSATAARTLAHSLSFPFTRPPDYFAEMVKSDAHMERIRLRLLNESAGIKKSEMKRKEREGKKFGKQVQIEKLKEREKGKKEMEERLKGLKRKRKDALDNPNAEDDSTFDIAVENAISDRPSAPKRSKTTDNQGKKISRQGRDKKFGFGGSGKRAKQNTKSSTDSFEFGGGRGKGRDGAKGRGGGAGGKGKGPAKRLGKSRRMAGKGRS